VNEDTIKLRYILPSYDLTLAGEASSSVKKTLKQLGIQPSIVKKVAIAMYEAEINAVIHAGGGVAEIEINEREIAIRINDEGPGIPDIELAMQEGYSTAPDSIREMGFGAGMGLPNIKRYADILEINSKVGKGTTVAIKCNLVESNNS
jgi:serine/threonine-protein kinase RsbT